MAKRYNKAKHPHEPNNDDPLYIKAKYEAKVLWAIATGRCTECFKKKPCNKH